MDTITLEQAIELHQQGKVTQAYGAYLQLSAIDKNNIQLLELLAMSAAQLGNSDAAIDHLKDAIDLSPEFAPLYNNMGQIYSQKQDLKKAQKYFEQALKIDPLYSNAMNNLGNIYLRNKNYPQANTLYQAAIDSDPTFVDPYFNLAMVHCHQNQLNQAETLFKKVLELDNLHAKALGQLAELYLNHQQYEQATDLFERRLKIQPRHAEAWHSLGQAQSQLKLYENAITSFKQCLAIHSQHPQANHDLANMLTTLGDHTTALNFYFKQLEINPLNESYFNIGVLLMYQERSKEAITYFEHAHKQTPDDINILINLASLYLKLKQYHRAQQYYEHALTLEPNNLELKHILAAITQQSLPQRAPAPYLTHLFDQYAPHYDQHLTQVLRYNVPNLLFTAVRDITDLNDFNLLDLGCGTGLCTEAFKPITQHRTGIDISEKMLAIAKQKAIYDELICSDIETYTYEKPNLNLIVAADVFSYLGDLSIVLQQCHANLTQKGLLCFTLEQSAEKDYLLQKNIRYAHHENYILKCLQQNHWNLLKLTKITLREQNKKPVAGFLVIAEKD